MTFTLRIPLNTRFGETQGGQDDLENNVFSANWKSNQIATQNNNAEKPYGLPAAKLAPAFVLVISTTATARAVGST
jgi:hypothetical protein